MPRRYYKGRVSKGMASIPDGPRYYIWTRYDAERQVYIATFPDLVNVASAEGASITEACLAVQANFNALNYNPPRLPKQRMYTDMVNKPEFKGGSWSTYYPKFTSVRLGDIDH